jgi:type IV secretory pathway VirB4 component
MFFDKNSINRLGIADISDDLVADFDCNLTKVYELEGYDFYSASNEKKLSFHNSLIAFLNNTPDYFVTQFRTKVRYNDKKILRKYQDSCKNTNRVACRIRDAIVEKYQKLNNRTMNTYLCVTPYFNKSKKLLYNIFSEPIQEAYKDKIKVQKEDLNTFIQTAIPRLNAIGIQCTEKKTQDIFDLCFEYLNPEFHRFLSPKKVDTKEDLFSNSFLEEHPEFKNFSIRDQLMPGNGLIINKECVEIDGYYAVCVNVEMMPESTDQYFIEKVLLKNDLKFDHDFFINYIPFPTEKAVKDLEKEKKTIELSKSVVSDFIPVISEMKKQNAMYKSKESLETDIEIKADSKLKEIVSTIKMLRENKQKYFRVSMGFVVLDKNKERCLIKAKKIQAHFNSINYIKSICDNNNQSDVFLSLLPGQFYLNRRKYPILTQALSYLLPVSSGFKGTEHLQLLMQNTENEFVPLSIVKNNLKASHTVVLGPTGTGKSFLINTILTNIMISNVNNDYITIIDLGDSYIKFVLMFGGLYFKVKIDEKYAINIFPKKKIIKTEEGYNYDLINMIKSILGLMILDDKYLPKLSKIDEYLLENEIENFYDLWTKEEAPLLGDFQNYLAKKEFIDPQEKAFVDMAVKILNLYTKGMFGKIFNRPSKLSFDKLAICFELSELDKYPKARAIYFALIQHVISLRMINSDKRQYIVVEELKKMIANDEEARFLEELILTIRKYHNHMIVVAQQCSHLIGNSCVDSIRKNSEIFYLLKIEKEVELLGEFGLNENEIESCKTLITIPGKLSQCFVKFGDDSFIMNNEPCPIEYEAFATDGESKKTYKVLEERGDVDVLELMERNIACKEEKPV